MKNIGACLDNKLDMVGHVSSVSRACYFHLRNIGRVRSYLSPEAAATLVHSFISSKLDYHNSLLYGVPDYLIKRLQLIQNTAARIVSRTKRTEHITPVLISLHWLPVRFRIIYKICLLTFKGLHCLAPQYICDSIAVHVPSRSLRSSSQNMLATRRYQLEKAGARAFSVAAPKLWNELPINLRFCLELDSFKSLLKTHLFKQAFNS